MGLVSILSAAPGPIPLVHVLTEAEAHRTAKRDAEAAVLYERVLQRIEHGEPVPAGVDRERLSLAAAVAHLRAGSFSSAVTRARPASGSSVPAVRSEARWVLALALWQGGTPAEAVPLLGELTRHPQWGGQALTYQAMAAREAGQIDLAATLYERLAETAPQATDAADAALALVELNLERGRSGEARRGLLGLARRAEAIDNVAGWALVVVRVADAALKEDDPGAALALYQSLPTREELQRRHAERDRHLEKSLATLRSLAGNQVLDFESVRRLEQRRAQGARALTDLSRLEDFDALLLARRGRAFHARGLVWEAGLVLERLIERHPNSPEREAGFALWIRSLVEAGRVDRLDAGVKRFLETYPASPHAAQALTLAAQAAGARGDRDAQLKWLDQALQRSPSAELAETVLILQAQALVAVGRHDDARRSAERSLADYPEGRFVEEATYLRAMAGLLLGQPQRALAELAAYRERFPQGRFDSDAQYREAAAHYALGAPESALEVIGDWLRRHPDDHAQRGEVLSLLGDVSIALRREDDAIAAYEQALALELNLEARGYVLDELTRLQVARREFEPAARRWEITVTRDPDSPLVVQAAYWIGRLRLQGGDPDGAITGMVSLVRRHLTDPSREDVERVLLELARVAHRPGPGTSVAGAAETWLLAPEQRSHPTARARAWFVDAERAVLARRSEEGAALLARIARDCPLESLPAGLLGRVGDALRADGDAARARAAYEHLVATAPRSPFADFAYVGLGDLALDDGRADLALTHYEAAIDQAGARFKLKEATLGRARCLLALERWDDARTVYEQLATHRAWRGEATAESVLALGEIQARRREPEFLAQAQGFFQRVYLGYRKFTPWVARAYLRSGEVFEQLGQADEALRTYRELLRDERLTQTDEAEQARRHVRRLEQKGSSV